MNIYLLERLFNLDTMPYGIMTSILIEAKDENEARQLAKASESYEEYKEYWLNKEEVSCEVVEIKNESRIIKEYFTNDA